MVNSNLVNNMNYFIIFLVIIDNIYGKTYKT